MRLAIGIAVTSVLLGPVTFGSSVEQLDARLARGIQANDNRSHAGVLKNGVLTVHLEVREGEWHPDRDTAPGIAIRAFAEEGHDASVPGPLIRVPEGTTIHATVRNALASGTLAIVGLSTRGSNAKTSDTLSVAAGTVGDVSFVAGATGTYFYTATVSGAPARDSSSMDAELNGALVIDARTAPPTPDRIFVLGLWSKTPLPGGVVNPSLALRFTINGKSWPNTERLAYSLGDTVRFRVINTSVAVHPMHLHGFYFAVTSRGNGVVDSSYGSDVAPYRVVTERVAPGRTATMTWTPERAGNWLFHCHDNYHILRNLPFDGTLLPTEEHMHVANHAMEMMGGLVLGIQVRGADRSTQGVPDADRRRLRLVARVDTGGTPPEPSFGYALDDGSTARARPSLIPGPTLVLKRGQPTAITVVNELPEATAVHWHGIELESYFDGVAGFAGQGTRIAPAIAPRDSFVARFTPPRSGTFIYHPHADELRQQTAGLSGVLLVVDDPATYEASHDIVVLVTAPRRSVDAPNVVYINGTAAPLTRELRTGEKYRVRLVDIHTFRPSMITRIVGNAGTLTWRALAKDGMDLPPVRAVVMPAQQQMANGETFDFEFVPPNAGEFRLTVSSAAGALLATWILRAQ